MQFSHLFGRTLRQAPPVPEFWTKLALRAAYIHLLEGEIVVLPLGVRVLKRIENILTSEFHPIQEVQPPDSHFPMNWRMLLQEQTQSYRQLPVAFQVRDYSRRLEWAPGNGRRFPIPCWNWFYLEESMNRLEKVRDLWVNNLLDFFNSIRLSSQQFECATNGVGWVSLQEKGPDRFLACSGCDYLALAESARFSRMEEPKEPLQESELISTPGAKTIPELADLLAIPESKILKSIFLIGDDTQLLLAILRGDLNISRTKIAHITGHQVLRPATEEEVHAAGAVPGYGSPVGLPIRSSEKKQGLFVIADPSIEIGSNFVMGANQEGFHLQGVNFPRDFKVTKMADIAAAEAGFPCPVCHKSLAESTGIHLAGWRTERNAIRYSGTQGSEDLGQVGIGTVYLDSIFTALLADYQDEDGLIWPVSIAPFDVHVIDLKSFESSMALVRSLESVGLEVLHDDREVSPGVKFYDADLIGCPVRLTVSKRNLKQDRVEMVLRADKEKRFFAMNDVVDKVRSTLSSIM